MRKKNWKTILHIQILHCDKPLEEHKAPLELKMSLIEVLKWLPYRGLAALNKVRQIPDTAAV